MKRILKAMVKPRILISLWLIFLATPFLSFLRLNYVVKNNILGLRILGFSTFLFYFPVLISIVVFLTLTLWLREFINKKLSRLHKKTLNILSILNVLFLVFSRMLLNLEQNNYPNYLYASYGISFSQLELMSFISALELFFFLTILIYDYAVNIKKSTKIVIKGTTNNEKASTLMVLVGLASLSILSLYPISNIAFTIREERKGYESKAGIHYKYIELMRDHIPGNATVIHPPQGEKWPAVGNQPFIRFFLYPRVLVSGALMNNKEIAQEISEAYFVEIDSISVSDHWPQINQAENDIIFDEKAKVNYKTLDVIFESEQARVFRVFF